MHCICNGAQWQKYKLDAEDIIICSLVIAKTTNRIDSYVWKPTRLSKVLGVWRIVQVLTIIWICIPMGEMRLQ
jgi:hypothetical protein